MNITLNEKSSLGTALERVDKCSDKLGFDSIETQNARDTVTNFHSLLTAPESEHINSEFRKTISGAKGKLTISASSSSQQGFFSKLFSV